MKTYYLRGGQDVNCYMIDAVGEDGSYCKTEDCKAEIDRLKKLVEHQHEIIEEDETEKMDAELLNNIIAMNKKITEQQAEIDELEILLYEAMKLIPVSQPILKTPTEILNWQDKVLIIFERRNKRKYKEQE